MKTGGGLNTSGNFFLSTGIFSYLETNLTTFYIRYVAHHVTEMFITFYCAPLKYVIHYILLCMLFKWPDCKHTMHKR